MLKKFVSALIERPWLRIGLVVVLLIVGLAPVGAPILSDSTLRQALRPASAPAESVAVSYRWLPQADGSSRVQRSLAGSGGASQPRVRLPMLAPSPAAATSSWQDAGAIPDGLVQVVTSRENPQQVYALGRAALWRSADGGTTWSRAVLPSRPLSLAVAQSAEGLLFAGTESAGLYRSADGGQTWQALNDALGAPGAGALGISALALNPDDERVVYAAAGYWLGTSTAHFAPQGIYVSVDTGAHWFPTVAMPPMDGAPATVAPLEMVRALQPAAGRPLAVTAVTASQKSAYELPVTPALVDRLNDADPGVRGAVARTLGLSGNHSVLPALLAHVRDGNASGEAILAGDALAEAIGRLADPAAVSPLQAALADPNEVVRARAAYALGLMQVSEVVPQLGRMLREDSPSVQERAAQALAAIGTPAALAALSGPLSDAEMTSARHAAMSAFEQAGEKATPVLTANLRSADPVLRRNSAEMLGWVRPAAATTDLAQALSDSDASVRTEAAWALGEIGTVGARRALEQAAVTEKDATARASAEHALAQARAEAASRPDPTLTPGAALMEALSEVPATSWTLLGLAIALAAIVLASGARRAPAAATR